MESEILVSSSIVSGNTRLDHLVWPSYLPENQAGAYLISAGRHNLSEFRHIDTNKVSLDFKDRTHMYPEARCLFAVLYTMSYRLTFILAAQLGCRTTQRASLQIGHEMTLGLQPLVELCGRTLVDKSQDRSVIHAGKWGRRLDVDSWITRREAPCRTVVYRAKLCILCWGAELGGVAGFNTPLPKVKVVPEDMGIGIACDGLAATGAGARACWHLCW